MILVATLDFIILPHHSTVKNVCSNSHIILNSSKYYIRNGKRNCFRFRKSVLCMEIYDEIGYIEKKVDPIPSFCGFLGYRGAKIFYIPKASVVWCKFAPAAYKFEKGA